MQLFCKDSEKEKTFMLNNLLIIRDNIISPKIVSKSNQIRRAKVQVSTLDSIFLYPALIFNFQKRYGNGIGQKTLGTILKFLGILAKVCIL